MDRQGNLRNKFGIENEDSVVNINEQISIIDSCTTITVPDFDPTVSNFLLWEDIVDSLYYINLETSDDFIVGSVDKIEIVNDTIYILDKKTNSVFSFSIDGKIGNKIGQVGNGPGEYVEATSMSVNSDFIFVYDQWQQKAIKYNHAGVLMSDHKLPFFCWKAVMLNNGDMLCYGAGMDNYHLPKILDYCFWQCDSTYSRISKVALFSEKIKTIGNGEIPLEHYNGKYYYLHNKTNDFYEITPEGSITHLVHVKFDPDYSEEFYTNIDYRINEMKENNAVAVSQFFITSKHIFYELSGWGYPNYFFYNINDKSIKFLNFIYDLQSDLSRVLPMTTPKFVLGDWLVLDYAPESLLRKYRLCIEKHGDLWDGAPEHVREFDKKLLESLHEEDNPILVFAKIKEHFD